jgi:hypothetical protein
MKQLSYGGIMIVLQYAARSGNEGIDKKAALGERG